MKFIKKTNDAVSPVVGVMLMLVVTIIIAAVVASFASGITGSTTATPNALITVQDVSTSSSDYLNDVLFVHKGGDSLSLANIKVSLNSFGMSSEFTAAEGTLTGDSTISVGDQITVDASGAWIYTPSESSIDYTIIDLTTGNAIASGTFVVP